MKFFRHPRQFRSRVPALRSPPPKTYSMHLTILCHYTAGNPPFRPELYIFGNSYLNEGENYMGMGSISGGTLNILRKSTIQLLVPLDPQTDTKCKVFSNRENECGVTSREVSMLKRPAPQLVARIGVSTIGLLQPDDLTGKPELNWPQCTFLPSPKKFSVTNVVYRRGRCRVTVALVNRLQLNRRSRGSKSEWASANEERINRR